MSKIVENDGKSWGNHEKNHGKWWRFDGNVENRKPNFSRPLIELRGAHTVCLQLTLVIDILWTARYWKYFETRIQFQFSLDWFKGKSKPETIVNPYHWWSKPWFPVKMFPYLPNKTNPLKFPNPRTFFWTIDRHTSDMPGVYRSHVRGPMGMGPVIGYPKQLDELYHIYTINIYKHL